MSPIKRQLPTPDALEQQFDAVLRGNFAGFLSSTHVRRQAVIGNRNYALLAGVFSIAILFSLYFIRSSYDNLVWDIFLTCAVLWLLIILLSARRWLTDNQLLAKEINMALVPIISNTLNRTVVYSFDVEHRNEVMQLLGNSALMTIEGINTVSDDMLTVYGDVELNMRELVVTKKQVMQNGKVDELMLFKGVFVNAKLPFTHNAETYISTDGDRSGFAHRTFWSDLFEKGNVKETTLEWNDFEKKLHIASTDAVAARELLTTDFMQDLYDWSQEHKLHMRISFKDDMFYMLLPETSIKIGFSTSSTDLKSIKKYAYSLIRPLWRSIMLVEDVIGK